MANLRTHGGRLLFAVVTVVMLLTASQAQASAIYTYTGSAFSNIFTSGPTTPADPYTTTDFVSGVLELSAPLAPNLAVFFSGNQTALSFSFSDGVNTITNINATHTSFSFSTDASGNIVSWAVSVGTDAPKVGGGTIKSIQSNHYPDIFPIFLADTRDFASDTLCGPSSTSAGCAFSGDPFYSQLAQVRAAGTWQLQTSQPVPEPATMLLLGTGLFGVMVRRGGRARKSRH